MTRDDQKGSELGTDTCLDVADEASLRRNGRCLVRVAGQDVAVLVSAAEVSSSFATAVASMRAFGSQRAPSILDAPAHWAVRIEADRARQFDVQLRATLRKAERFRASRGHLLRMSQTVFGMSRPVNR